MKRMKKLLLLVLLVMFIVTSISSLSFSASAASNPYPTSQYIEGVTTIPCTYYAWQQTYDRLGIALPAWGNAINWYNAAANAGYSVGSVPKANSIAVWSISSHSYGHVAYVTSVNSSGMVVNEGGRIDAAGNGGIVNGETISATTVGSWWGSRCLVGFIYLSEAPSVSLSWTDYSDKHWIGSTNAVLARRCDLNIDVSAITKVGIYLYDYKGTELKSKSENISFSGFNYVTVWYDVNSELGYTLATGTTYKYKFMAVVNGKTYYSPVYSFKTTGTHSHKYNSGSVTKSPGCETTGTRTYTCTTCGGTKTESIAATGHSYGSWSTTKAATCTATGTQTRKCSKCSKTETKSIAALGHNYSASWTTDKVASCTTAGSKSHHCTRCTAKKDVTSISATGHSYGSWSTTKVATCTAAGAEKRTCSKCSSYETRDIKATGHNFGSWQVSVAATTEKAGTEIRKCSNSGCKTAETRTIPKLPEVSHTHQFGEWQTKIEAGCETDGLLARTCSSCSEEQTQTVSAIGHKFGDWKQTEAPTAEKEGTEERQCDNCSNIEKRTVAKLTVDNAVSNDSDSSDTVSKNESEPSDTTYFENKETNGDSFDINYIYWFLPIVIFICVGSVVVTIVIMRKKYK